MTDQESHTSANEMPKAYQPAEIEPRVYQRWLDADVFAPDGTGSRAKASLPPFVIIQPPPNATGALHIGHALVDAVEDLMIRRARMQGHETLWLPGIDHASIAAQYVFDAVLEKTGESRESLGRDEYLRRIAAFVAETRTVISRQQRRLGASADWSRERFTMDEISARAVRTAFKQLYDDGLAYRGERLINWCPGCNTSISDLEVIGTPETGTLWFVRYHLVRYDGTPDPDATITVATTRPETILGDTGVAVHPGDDRYAALVGRTALIPFVDRPVPIVADAAVQAEFGTGAVKVTPAHDPTDFEIGERHSLPTIDVMTDDAHMNAAAGPYAGLSLAEARRRVVADLDARGDLVETRPHEMVIGRCQRSGDIVEPRLKVQWFINVKPLAARAMATVRAGRTTFMPHRFEKVFFNWMENIRDWNVSRQLWWGHRIPAWYCPDGHITVSAEADGPDACSVCGRPAAEMRQEDDIFDTWFSSGLWPMSTLGWPEETPDLAHYYPGTVMETGYDIIFFWVARMMMLGEWLTGREAFHTVYLHGMVRDPLGAKMSKTKGNVVDPLGVIDEVGADALRFALIHGSAPGMDQRLGVSRLDGARNFGNKIWNACRFVLGARPPEIGPGEPLDLPAASELGPADHWILARCAATIADVEHAYAAFQFGEATRLLHDAIWNDYCDWYLELAKVESNSDDPARRAATWRVLAWVLDRYLRLLHPVMPHLTEELWGRLPHRLEDPGLLIVADWPDGEAEAGLADAATADGVQGVIELIGGIRNARTEAGIEPGTWLDAVILPSDAPTRAALASLEASVARLARVHATLAADTAELGTAADALTVLVRSGEARLSRAGADLDRERQRLVREREQAQAALADAQARLADARFVERAPAAVVSGVRVRATELAERISRLSERIGS